MNRTRLGVGLAWLALLTACQENPAAPAAVPTLDRPVLVLKGPAAAPAGDTRVVIRIPQAALVERGGIPGVFVLSAQQQSRFRMVKQGKMGTGQVEILSGLHGDETLVLGDLKSVHDGSPIKPH
jgi:hypothetical protein